MSIFTKRTTRIVAGTLVGAMALSVSPILGFAGIASAADALPPIAEPIGAGNFCEGSPTTEPFTDVQASDPSFDEIVCLVATNLTKGTTATTYSPNASITRRQMALFIKRLADLANTLDTGTQVAPLPAYDGTQDFADIAAESTETQTAIGQLSQADIVNGTTATTYSPGQDVSRRQMAAFINRLELFLTGAAFTTSGDFFDDDEGDTGEANLNAVASVGIFQGDGAGNVFPGADLTRRQMANVLLRHAQVMFDAGDIKRAFATSTQTFTVTPADAATLGRTANPEAPATTTDDRQYTVNGLDNTKSYVVALFSGADIQTTSGVVTFDDATGDNIADRTVPDTDISVVNGTAQAADTSLVTVSPVSGTIAFTLDGDNVDETVVPVIWLDSVSGGTSVLNLTIPTTSNNNPKTAAESFGIGGAVTYAPVEAGLGGSTPTVTSANIASDYFSSAAATYFYDANDVFQYQGVGITFAQFESMISSGDILTVAYNPDAAGVSTFNITTDAAPAAFAITSAVAKNLDAGTTANDVQVTFTPPATNAAGVTYKLQRAAVLVTLPCGGNDDTTAADATFADVVTTTVTNADGTRTFTDSNVANGCYDYRIVATNPVSGTSTNSAKWVVTSAGNGVLVPGAADTQGPRSTFLNQTNGSGFSGTLDSGDTIKVVFDEVLAAPNNGDKIRFLDADGTIVDVTCGTNATCSLNAAAEIVNAVSRPAGWVLTLTLTADPTIISAGTVVGEQVASGAVSDQAGNTDLVGNAWDRTGSTDLALA